MAGVRHSDTPLLRVSRPVSACSRCRRAKIKCDGKLPACTACEKNGRSNECSSANDQFAKGKERSYVASLESRIEKLQLLLDQHKANKLSMPTVSGSTSVPFQLNPAAPLQPKPGRMRQANRQEATEVDDLVSDFGFLVVNATSRDFFGFTSQVSFAKLILASATLEGIPASCARSLPPRHIATAMVQHYLDHIFVLLPFFSETTLFASFDAMYSHQGRNASDWDYWSINMVLAIASASLSRQKGDGHDQNAMGLAAAALSKADSVLHPGSITGLQAILFLVQFATLHPTQFDSWYLIGIASRTTVDLGLHQDEPRQKQSQLFRTELRRRVFYCVYALDRSISMVLARAFSFSDSSINVAIPTILQGPSAEEISMGSPLQPLDSFLELNKIRMLQSEAYQELFQSERTPYADVSRIWSICQDFRKWSEAVPEKIPYLVKRYLELELLYSFVFVLGPSRRMPETPSRGLSLTFEYCVSYAEKASALFLSPDSRVFYSYHDALRLYFIGGRLLDTLFKQLDQIFSRTAQAGLSNDLHAGSSLIPEQSRSHQASRAVRAIETISQVLEQFGRRWAGAQSLSQQFKKESSYVLTELDQRQQPLKTMSETAVPTLTMTADDKGKKEEVVPEWRPLPSGLNPPVPDTSWEIPPALDAVQRHHSA